MTDETRVIILIVIGVIAWTISIFSSDNDDINGGE